MRHELRQLYIVGGTITSKGLTENGLKLPFDCIRSGEKSCEDMTNNLTCLPNLKEEA